MSRLIFVANPSLTKQDRVDLHLESFYVRKVHPQLAAKGKLARYAWNISLEPRHRTVYSPLGNSIESAGVYVRAGILERMPTRAKWRQADRGDLYMYLVHADGVRTYRFNCSMPNLHGSTYYDMELDNETLYKIRNCAGEAYRGVDLQIFETPRWRQAWRQVMEAEL